MEGEYGFILDSAAASPMSGMPYFCGRFAGGQMLCWRVKCVSGANSEPSTAHILDRPNISIFNDCCCTKDWRDCMLN